MSIHKKYHPVLIALARSDHRTQKTLLRSVGPEIVRILARIAANIISGDFPLNPRQKRRLRPYQKTLLSLRDNPKGRRRTLLKQKGGFLPLLIPLIASAVGGLLGKSLG